MKIFLFFQHKNIIIFHESKNKPNGYLFPRSRVLCRVQSDSQGHGSGSHQDRPPGEHSSVPHPEPRSSPYFTPREQGCLSVGSDERDICSSAFHRLRDCVRDITAPISSVLLSRKMKYLVLGPASMGIFALIGGLKARESQLVDVQEISGSSAGSILALFLAAGMSVDEILETATSINLSNFFKIKLGSFFTKFGFVDVHPIRKKLVDICGSDPTFSDLEMKIYISAFCLNTSETVYFSKDTHPEMKVIDAVCMSMAVPFIFSCGTYMDKTYVDGGMKEEYPLTPFLDKKPHEITCMKVRINQIYQEDINTPRQFVETLVRSALSNREKHDKPVEELEINIGDTNIFDFSMSYEEKIRLFNTGYTFLN